MFNKLCIIGVGLIGSSVARAAREKKQCNEIVAYGRQQDSANLQRALELGVIDAFYTDIEAAVRNADLVVIATPVGAVENIFRQLKPFWDPRTVYTDVGSTKGSVVAAAKKVFGQVPEQFVPAHPIAGAENSGVEAGKADLFSNKRVILTPLAENATAAVDSVRQFWQALGANVSEMGIVHHDKVLAATSHLPHILAFALVDLLGRKDEQEEIFKYAAGGFKDFTRIASSDPTMWQDICLANKEEIIPLIQQLKTELGKIEQLLTEEKGRQLSDIFAYAQRARQRFLDLFNH
jgi:prephenate dehydrogenase